MARYQQVESANCPAMTVTTSIIFNLCLSSQFFTSYSRLGHCFTTSWNCWNPFYFFGLPTNSIKALKGRKAENHDSNSNHIHLRLI